MFKWIRWGGLISFVIIFGGLAAFFIFAAGPLAKIAIEKFGTQANGALVEVNDVAVSLNPIGLKIEKLQVTDAKQPMRNSLEFDSALAELELAPLLAGNLIIKELSLNGLRFDTQRSKSGFVAKPVEKVESKPTEPSILDSVDLPDPKEILNKEKDSLTTEKLGQELEQRYKANMANLDAKLAAVPNEDSLAKYEDDVQRILKTKVSSANDFKKIKADLDALKAQFKQDQQAIQDAQEAIKTAKSQLQEGVKNLERAPGNDLKTLKDKYQLNAAGAANLSASLFGDDAGQWASQALYWYEKVQPYLSKADEEAKPKEVKIPRGGYLVQFKNPNPWPSFLLRHAVADAQTQSGAIHLRAQDITHQQQVIGRTSQIFADSTQLKNIDQLNLKLEFNHLSQPARDSLNLNLNNWFLTGMKLGVAGLKLADSNSQLTVTAEVVSGKLNVQAMMDFAQAKFESEDETVLAKELKAALDTIAEFNLIASAKGKLTSPNLSLSSNLDKQLQTAFNARLKQKQKEFEQELERQLQAKAADMLGRNAKYLDQFNQLDGSLNSKLKQVQKLAGNELEDFTAQQKREAEEKAKAELKAAEDKAKAEAEAKKNEAEAKAKKEAESKLKSLLKR